MKISQKVSYALGTKARTIRTKLGLPINQKLIRFCGIQRSGNHAVINWMIAQEHRKTCFINGAFPGTNPWHQNWGIAYPNFPYWPKERDIKGALVSKELFIFSYENQPLSDIEADKSALADYIGNSREDYTVVILRDPYNTFASWMKRHTPVTPSVIELWKRYAYEFVGKSNLINSPKILVSFNQWFSDQTYRQNLAHQLGLEFTDHGLREVSHHGGGSSFDGQGLRGQATHMNVLTRFHHYVSNPQFQAIFEADAELKQLSDQIFGELPNVEQT
ncbi:hypothetical protein PN498_28020 [Oscillatoria sp. CS-180]|uniref:hypothetical protein n=1 Tax=Oscillatoria sp. CS-180 TaxID=3021720 RepID=UPI00232D8D26|nr:hypothetical protein [Oscillatoria sp. CS-180]MDB9529866.1 hypothetical protein [Oscillatoria sp. CS-180]